MKVNGKTYKLPVIDFNAICELEDMGFSVSDMSKKPLSASRAFLALCLNGDVKTAGAELEAHLSAGGTFDELMKEIGAAMTDSGFFRSLAKNKETETVASEK